MTISSNNKTKNNNFMKIHLLFLSFLFLSFALFSTTKDLESLLSQSTINPEEVGTFLEEATHFIKNGADPNTYSLNGYTVLMLAAWNRFSTIVQTLLELNADPNLQDIDYLGKNTALICAMMQGDLESITLLLDHGADPNIKNFYGETALWWAARKGDTESVTLLLKHGADPNIRTVHGDTTLIKAVENNKIEVVKILLAHQADKTVAKNNGDTPLMIAQQKELSEIIKLLT